jgi:hypothetical protein
LETSLSAIAANAEKREYAEYFPAPLIGDAYHSYIYINYPHVTMKIHLIAVIITGMTILSGCATTIKEQQARGNMIVVARYDSRFPEARPNTGRVFADNAGALPSAMAGAAGVPTSAAGGAVLDVGVGLALNLLASEAYKDRILMAFKVLYEDKCEYGLKILDLRKSPDSQKLYPGYIARVSGDKDDNVQIAPVTDANGKQAYLSKTHPCYANWVSEWKEHQRVLSSRSAPWDARRFDPVFGSVPLDRFPDPKLDWVK